MTTQRVEDTLKYHIAAQLLPLQGLFVVMVMPIYSGGLVKQFGFSSAQIAQLATADSVGSFISLAALTIWLKSMDRKLIAYIALAIIIGSNLANSVLTDYASTLVLRALHGAAGTAIFGLACAFYGNTAQPDRWFAWRATLAVCIQSLAFQFAPKLIDTQGVSAIYFVSVMFTPLTLWAIANLPNRPLPYLSHRHGDLERAVTDARDTKQPNIIIPILLWLVASAAFGFYYQPLFVFSERLGDQIGLSLEQVGTVLAVSTFLGIIGSIAVSWQGDRLGRALPIALGTLAGLAVCLLLYFWQTIPSYWIGLSLFSIVWSYLPCFMQGYISVSDRSGRAIVAAQLLNVGGAALATTILGVIIDRAGLNSAVYLAIIGIILTGVFALVGAALYRRKPPIN